MDLVVPAIWSPIETQDEIFRFRWDETGLGEIKKDEIPSGHITAFSGNKLVVASHKYSDVTDGNVFPASIEIRSFELSEDGVEATGSVDIGPGYLNYLTINSTGTQAVIIRSQYTLMLDAQPKPSAGHHQRDEPTTTVDRGAH